MSEGFKSSPVTSTPSSIHELSRAPEPSNDPPRAHRRVNHSPRPLVTTRWSLTGRSTESPFVGARDTRSTDRTRPCTTTQTVQQDSNRPRRTACSFETWPRMMATSRSGSTAIPR